MEYEVIYSARRTLSLCIKNEKLIVRAPFGTPGKKIDEAIRTHEEWIVKNIERQHKKNEKAAALTEEEIKELKKLARKVLKFKTDHYAALMGLKYGRITITSATTRFGSCSSKGNIAFSYRLMLYPEDAIDYVVVHELAHLVEMNHSRDFYAIVEKYLPDYKRRKKLLR